jgi:hypothetical protein
MNASVRKFHDPSLLLRCASTGMLYSYALRDIASMRYNENEAVCMNVSLEFV